VAESAITRETRVRDVFLERTFGSAAVAREKSSLILISLSLARNTSLTRIFGFTIVWPGMPTRKARGGPSLSAQ
jgi:hypothetical protein